MQARRESSYIVILLCHSDDLYFIPEFLHREILHTGRNRGVIEVMDFLNSTSLQATETQNPPDLSGLIHTLNSLSSPEKACPEQLEYKPFHASHP